MIPTLSDDQSPWAKVCVKIPQEPIIRVRRSSKKITPALLKALEFPRYYINEGKATFADSYIWLEPAAPLLPELLTYQHGVKTRMAAEALTPTDTSRLYRLLQHC